MKKSILNLGKALNRAEQQEITGGKVYRCNTNPDCPPSPNGCCIGTGSRCFITDNNGASWCRLVYRS
ncbi:hypothetical protein OAT18_02410 [Tenacibaculum sp.]|nr:hypothetical protein [Tenacibaculum sp.]